MTVEAGKQLGRGIINSIITYFGADSMDVLTPDGLPEEAVEFLRRMLNYYSEKDKRLAEAKGTSFYDQLEDYYSTGITTYQMLNQFGQVGNLFRMQEDKNDAAASLKYILGRFTVKEVTENGVQGYRIYDKYDFKNNQEYFEAHMPEIYKDTKEKGYDTSAVDGQIYMTLRSIDKNLAKPNRSMLKAIAHPIARTLGGWFIGEDRPEEDKIKIDFFLPKVKAEPYLENDTVMPVKYADETISEVPIPRPEDFSAYIPNGPMDNKRASMFETFMKSIIPSAKATTVTDEGEVEIDQSTIVRKDPTTVKTPFQQAFAEARARGDKTFEFINKDGITKSYTTEVADG